MKLRFTTTVATVTAVLSIATSLSIAGPQKGAQKRINVPQPSSPAAELALLEALAGPDGEYAAQAFYAAILQKFGSLLPYQAIAKAEERHANALVRQLATRGLAAPENPYTTELQLPATLKEAAELAVVAEQRNILMYDQLIALVKDQPELVGVFTQLQRASREHHLPAFTAAATNNGQLTPGELGCRGGGQKCGQMQAGPPSWAGNGSNCGDQCAGECPTGGSNASTGKAVVRKGQGQGCGSGPQSQCPRGL